MVWKGKKMIMYYSGNVQKNKEKKKGVILIVFGDDKI
jgi:hypothetical protein